MREYEHHLFYSGNTVNENTILLDERETNHAVSALRLKSGERIRITDGRGAIYDCRCIDIGGRSISCLIQDKTYVPRLTPEMTLLVGLPDKERFETILEHAAALGAARIVPLVMEHCRKPWWGAWEKSRERFTAKMTASMKQCLYPYTPLLDAPAALDAIIDTCEKPVVVADQQGRCLCDDDITSREKLTCLIGPPGGISPKESALLESHKSLFIKIAPTRLRTELAAAVMCSRVMALSFR